VNSILHMKICVAQTRPIKGDVEGNIENHKKLIEIATARGAEMTVFPELSLTGYEPELAGPLAMDQDDVRFDEFQKISDSRQIIIGVGAPTKNGKRPWISLVLFQPQRARQTYSKQYLHADEGPYFSRGENHNGLIAGKSHNIALAICYELSVPAHADAAFQNGADIYIASVAKTAKGVANAMERLSALARQYSMTVLMANCLGHCGGYDCAGKSAIWSSKGSLLEQLDDSNEGVLMIDSETQWTVSNGPRATGPETSVGLRPTHE
jgi:predicted amidohydrolase